jgi:hypothetical protein
MHFSEKLSLLMDITKTSNSALARYVSLDASYISRLRGGKRLLPRNDANVHSMAAYFARNCKEEYKRKVVSEAVGTSRLPMDPAELSDMIAQWLLKEKNTSSDSVSQFLGGLSAVRSGVPSTRLRLQNQEFTKDQSDFPGGDPAVYYGIEGKRQAVTNFLSQAISMEKPCTLLLFSDEETSWMTADPSFAQLWASLMFQTLSKGHRIKIIHTISRDLDEMLSAIAQWMPLYMAGEIEPYFYPKKRDGVFKHTFFIIPGLTAVVSGSIGDQTSQAVNLLFHEPAAVNAYEEEFSAYLRLCRPLMRIFNKKNRENCFTTLKEFEREQSNAIIRTESLTLLTMPEGLLADIFLRNRLLTSEILEVQKLRVKNFRYLLNTYTFSEIIILPDLPSVLEGRVKIALSDMMEGGAIYYTAHEYLQHLKSVAKHLKFYENYHIHVLSGPAEDRYAVYVKEESGVIVAKTSLPPVVLAMSEGNMTAAFWDFLKSMMGAKVYEHPQDADNLQKLNEYIDRLEQMINN